MLESEGQIENDIAQLRETTAVKVGVPNLETDLFTNVNKLSVVPPVTSIRGLL